MSRCRFAYSALGAVLEPTTTGCWFGVTQVAGRQMEHRFQHSSIDSGRQMERYSWSMPAAAANSLQRTPAMTCSHHVHASQEVAVRAYAHLAYWKWHSWDSFSRRQGSSMAANDLKKGMLLEQDGGRKLLEVQQAFHNAGQARQGGFVSIDCRDVHSGAKSKLKFTSGKMVEVADTQWRKMQYLYTDEEGVHVMDAENFEQFCVPKASASGVMDWLQDGLEVSALMHDDSPVIVAMPPLNITVQVEETIEARISVASSRKSAVVNTGATVMVPSFVQKGEYIIVTPSNGEFVSRAKS